MIEARARVRVLAMMPRKPQVDARSMMRQLHTRRMLNKAKWHSQPAEYVPARSSWTALS